MKFKRAGENDVEKLIELIKGKFSALSKVAFSGKYSDLSEKATAADVGALPLTGGTINDGKIDMISNYFPMLNIVRKDYTQTACIQLTNGSTDQKGILLEGFLLDDKGTNVDFHIRNRIDNVELFTVSKTKRNIYDYKSKNVKEIMVQGDSIIPTVKATRFTIKDGNLKVKGTKSNVDTDITEIVKKAYTGSEGMAVGIATNGMGYIVAQNFFIDCSLITDDERKLIQSFDSIKIEKANDSSDYPTLMPAESDYEVGVSIRGKSGHIDKNVKMGIRSNNSVNYFYYTLPSEFKNDDNSSNNLRFATKEWVTFVGIDVKSR